MICETGAPIYIMDRIPYCDTAYFVAYAKKLAADLEVKLATLHDLVRR